MCKSTISTNPHKDYNHVVADFQERLSRGSNSSLPTSMPTFRLASGYEMPMVAYGTFRSAPGDSFQTILQAIEVGYRHFDCAHVYGNEKEIGSAFAHAIDTEMVTRDDLFVTGKLWNSDHDPEIVPLACAHSLSNLGLEYFDLYLIHFPVCWKHTGLENPSWGKSELGDTPIIETWRAMESLVSCGLCRSIGVSNFPLAMLHDLVTQATPNIPISCHQIESHVYYARNSLVRYCQSRNICVTAHTPLCGGKANEEWTKAPSALEDPIVIEIASKLSVSPSQVLLRYLLQRGIVVLPKSIRQDRMFKNIHIFGFKLGQGDMDQLSQLDKYRSFKTNPNPMNSVLGGPDAFTPEGTDIFD